jgi:hypothetical protein
MEWTEVLAASEGTERHLSVLNVRFTQMTKALVAVLDFLLRRQKRAGLLISIDRPHAFISRLLEKHGIPQETLMYLDTVTNLSGEPAIDSEKLELLASPFCINFLTSFRDCHSTKAMASGGGFILVDNLCALSTYMTEECVEKLIAMLGELKTECLIVLDKDRHGWLFDALVKRGASEIDLGDTICV